MEFLNREQRDPRLNEILYPYYDVRKSQGLINLFEGQATAAMIGDHQSSQPDASEHSRFNSFFFVNRMGCTYCMLYTVVTFAWPKEFPTAVIKGILSPHMHNRLGGFYRIQDFV
jgi:hypothetical protein